MESSYSLLSSDGSLCTPVKPFESGKNWFDIPLERPSESPEGPYHYDEFQMLGHPKPSDDMIFPLACSVFNFPPSEDWCNIFCWFPESEIIDLDVVKGKTKYIWKVINREQGPDCYFIHFSSIATKEWLYKRESYRLLCHVKGKRPSGAILGIMYAYCRMVRLYHIALYRTKIVVFKCLSRVGLK